MEIFVSNEYSLCIAFISESRMIVGSNIYLMYNNHHFECFLICFIFRAIPVYIVVVVVNVIVLIHAC